MSQLPLEILIVGILTAIVGLIISYIMMGEKSNEFKHWNQVGLSYFITGALIHIICEFTKINKWYCSNGHACAASV
jgi:uncharacterized integral membrane protein